MLLLLNIFATITLLCLLPTTSYAISHEKQCRKFLGELADSQSKFVMCVTKNSVPVTICTSCNLEHENMLIKYHSIKENCSEEYFDKNRMNGVQKTQSQLDELWTKPYCDDCNIDDHYEGFSNRSREFNACLGKNDIDPCRKCELFYEELNQYYTQLDQKNNAKVCFDIQDMMNSTRKEWSQHGCSDHQFNVLLFLVASGIAMSLPAAFYGGAYVLGKHRERNHGMFDAETVASAVGESNMPTSSNQSVGNAARIASARSEQNLPQQNLGR